MGRDKNFLVVTNKDIYVKLEKLEQKIDEVHTQSLLTNGKVKIHRYWLSSLTGAAGGAFLYVLSLIMKGG